MDVSENSGTPKSSILIRFSIINNPFWGTPLFGNTHVEHNNAGLQDDFALQKWEMLRFHLNFQGFKIARSLLQTGTENFEDGLNIFENFCGIYSLYWLQQLQLLYTT